MARTVRIWHASPPNFFADAPRAREFPIGYLHVADVEVHDADSTPAMLDEAFAKSQHVESDWQENAGVTPWVRPARSTSTGDIIVDDASRVWMCAMVGWEQVTCE